MRTIRFMPLICLCVGLGVSRGGAGQGGKNPGEVNTPPAKGERKETKLSIGQRAPDFTLQEVKKPREVKLSSFQNKKPVVLIFGSYT